MKYFSLNGQWNLYQSASSVPVPAQVPGCVHLDLLANGQLEDPFFRDNELKQMWVGETDWRYERRFVLTPELLAYERVLLRCYGLDTIADIDINGRAVGHADNMHRTWEFDAKPFLQAGENTIGIAFAAPLPYARRMDAEKGQMAGWVEPMRLNSAAWIRKEPCNFGWDWGPKMVTSGIWRDIELVAFNSARLADVLITQQHAPHEVVLTLKIVAEQTSAAALTADLTVKKDGKTVAAVDNIALAQGAAATTLTISQPELWWVNHLGAQPLYDVEITLRDTAGTLLDTWTKRIGLRTLTLERHPDQWGESFYFACNGVPFFAKGANWIPATPYPGQPVDYAALVQAAADAHMNMLRVWGGGVYEDDAFYAQCDAKGIAVWQDFMFACGTYPSFDAEFMANVKAEAQDVVRRLRHHACLALWCGNNEIEQGLPDSPGWLETMSWDDYSRLFDGLLADVVRALAPQTAYWPGSPHTPLGDRRDHRNPTCGDTHLWDVWHGQQPFEWYHTRLDRFVSEFGFQSFPEPQTVAEFTLPEDRSITSYVMEHHQRSGIGNSTIIHYLLDWFRLPTSFESTLWLSQILQGMAMKYAVEHWRRNMPRSMGTLYWQLNDLWPAPSWASLDWRLNWKALHYMAKRFYAPLLLSHRVIDYNAQVEIHLSNDRQSRQNSSVTYTVTDAQGKTLEQGTFTATIAAGSSAHVHTLDVRKWVLERSTRDVLIWLRLDVEGETVGEDLALLCRPKHLALRKPQLTTRVQAAENGAHDITLTTDSTALYVWLELPGAKFSDNFVHLRPGAGKTLRVWAQDVRALRMHSLYDTYQ
ncbi:MAG: glycoside hydrolase family 2 protein [Chloroflexi bacterium]|nr:glycoside hydrolase family 2 protein [Chloroflexota bacterium]